MPARLGNRRFWTRVIIMYLAALALALLYATVRMTVG